jgi:hypothetical protein
LNHYIYVYCDPRKPGRYQYGDLEFSYEPFYVGRGSGDRWKPQAHLGKSDNNFHLKRLINKISIDQIVICSCYKSMDEEKVNLMEKHYIEAIGRYDLKKGPLTNKTGGGEGVCGLRHTFQTRQKMSKTRKGVGHNPEWVAKIAAANRNKKHTTGPRTIEQRLRIRNNTPNLKLNKEKAEDIRKQYKTGKFTQREIAKLYGIQQSCISEIVTNKVWIL